MSTNGLLSMIFSLLGSLFALGGCQSSNPDESLSPNTETSPIKPQETTFVEFFSGAEVADVSLEEAIAQSNCVVRAK